MVRAVVVGVARTVNHNTVGDLLCCLWQDRRSKHEFVTPEMNAIIGGVATVVSGVSGRTVAAGVSGQTTMDFVYEGDIL